MTEEALDIEATDEGRTALAESREDRASSKDALQALEEMASTAGPSRPDAWRDDVLAALDELTAQLQQQYKRTTEPDSLLSQVARDAPHLAGSVEDLRSRQVDLIDDFDHLRTRLSDFSRSPDISGTRSALARLTADVRELRAWEADIVHEAYYVDLGVGD